MARTVQLSEEAYATLSALKQKGESFSDTVLRLARRGKGSILDWKPGRRESWWTPERSQAWREETRRLDAERSDRNLRRRRD